MNSIKKSALCSLFLLIGVLPSSAQIPPQRAIERARDYVSRIQAVVEESQPKVYSDPYSESIIVSLDGFVSVYLEPDGAFGAFFNGRRRPPETGPGHFRTDEEVWQAAEALVAEFDPPPGLQRYKLKRRQENTDVIYCEFNMKPYGYWSDAGNTASISFQASDGAVLHLIVGRGWNYEPPDIRISEQQARAIASARTQRDLTGWRYVIKWTTSTPDLERRGVRKTQRLIYSMYRDDSDDGVLIDTVTGDLVAVFTGLAGRDLSGGQNDVAKPMNSTSDVRESSQKPLPARAMSPLPYLLPAVGLLSILVAIALWRAHKWVARS